MRKPGNPTGKGGFKKGGSGNPGGKRKDTKAFIEECKEHAEEAIKTLLDCLRDKHSASARIKAAEIIIQYAHGKPSQNVQVSGLDGKDLIPANLINTPPPLDRQEWIKTYNQALVQSLSQ